MLFVDLWQSPILVFTNYETCLLSDVRIPVTLSKEDNISYFAGDFIIKRADFKVGTGEWADLNVVANDVRLKFKLAISSNE